MRAAIRLPALIGFALAAYDDVAAQNRQVELKVRPRVCITSRQNEECELHLLVNWTSDTQGQYCLFVEDGQDPIICWPDESSGETEDDKTVSESFKYWLTGQDIEISLAETRVEILSLESDDRRRNRRHRHVWSIF